MKNCLYSYAQQFYVCDTYKCRIVGLYEQGVDEYTVLVLHNIYIHNNILYRRENRIGT